MAHKTHYQNKAGKYIRVKVVSSPREKIEDKYGESVSRNVYLTFPAKVSAREVAYAAREIFETYCQHSYDCCGHWYCSPLGYMAKKVRGRTWMVPLSYNKNV